MAYRRHDGGVIVGAGNDVDCNQRQALTERGREGGLKAELGRGGRWWVKKVVLPFHVYGVLRVSINMA